MIDIMRVSVCLGAILIPEYPWISIPAILLLGQNSLAKYIPLTKRVQSPYRK